jgi:GTPase SAR1 family protein
MKEVTTFSEEPDLYLFLVGCKSDLLRNVDRSDAINLANQLKAEYWEVSAKTDTNVKELFNRISFLVWQQQLTRWAESQAKQEQSQAFATPNSRRSTTLQRTHTPSTWNCCTSQGSNVHL